MAQFALVELAGASYAGIVAKKTKMPTDVNQRAAAIVALATGQAEPETKDEARAEGGRKGAKGRSDKLTAEERSEIARKAARARWGSPAGARD